MCSYHCANIIKKCGGGNGKKPLTCLWMFNLLSSCSSVQNIEMLKEKYLYNMYPSDRHYLLSVPDESQFRAVWCAMTSIAQMNGKSASSGVESMNQANMNVRKKMAVDASMRYWYFSRVTVTDSRSTRSKHGNEPSCSLHVA